MTTVASHLPHSSVWVIILELIEERNHMLVTTVVSHLPYSKGWVIILELIQERKHMIVITVLSHLPHSSVWVIILELTEEKNHFLVTTVVSHYFSHRGYPSLSDATEGGEGEFFYWYRKGCSVWLFMQKIATLAALVIFYGVFFWELLGTPQRDPPGAKSYI